MMNIIEMEKLHLVRFKERLNDFIERTNIMPTDCKFQLYGIKIHEGFGEQLVYFYKKIKLMKYKINIM
ncbi:hypothetical protein [Terrisporobacter sp.]|uniref:hypothetical protein n=1 Tax=Terrisporobacter sp. TaxID=1965305 RepID=UPI00260C91C0|nr:hypothetical protein [Terrisporobacter sp.]